MEGLSTGQAGSEEYRIDVFIQSPVVPPSQ